MTFAQFKAEIRERLWPDGGDSETLWFAADGESPGPHQKQIVDALIEIQRSVDCIQQNHRDIIPHCDTYVECSSGLSITQAPRGRVHRLVAVSDDADCDEVNYEFQADVNALRDWCVRRCERMPESTPSGSLPVGVVIGSADYDKRTGRAVFGGFAIHNRRIYIAPRINSDERLIIEWSGNKTSWGESDEIDATPELINTASLYVLKEHIRLYDPDKTGFAAAASGYAEALANMIADCNLEKTADVVERTINPGSRIAMASSSSSSSSSQSTVWRWKNGELQRKFPDGWRSFLPTYTEEGLPTETWGNPEN